MGLSLWTQVQNLPNQKKHFYKISEHENKHQVLPPRLQNNKHVHITSALVTQSLLSAELLSLISDTESPLNPRCYNKTPW